MFGNKLPPEKLLSPRSTGKLAPIKPNGLNQVMWFKNEKMKILFVNKVYCIYNLMYGTFKYISLNMFLI